MSDTAQSTAKPTAGGRKAKNRRRTQEERREESTKKLMVAAAELFAHQGYDRTTFVQIAEKSGYSSGLIAHRFGTKSALVDALVLEIQIQMRDDVLKPALEMKSPGARLNSLISAYADALETGGEILKALFVLMAESVGPLAEKRDVFAKLNQTFIKLIEAQISEGQKSGEFKKGIETRMLAIETVASLRGVTLMWLIDPAGIQLKKICERVRTELLKKLRS